MKLVLDTTELISIIRIFREYLRCKPRGEHVAAISGILARIEKQLADLRETDRR